MQAMAFLKGLKQNRRLGLVYGKYPLGQSGLLACFFPHIHGIINKMTVERLQSNENTRNVKKFVSSGLILFISFLSILSDIIIGLTLIAQYYFLGLQSWAIMTFCFIFFPSVILQILSVKLCLSKRNMLPLQWLLHSLLLGIIYRYISAIIKCIRSYKSKCCTDSNLIKADLIILKNLYLFKTFLECAPQLVLQLYFIAVAPMAIPQAGIIIATSVFSIAWSMILHTKIKKENCWPRLLFLVLWRTGMITARISALVVCAFACGPWMILFIGSHWLAMTLWITYQKAASDDKDKKEFHSALFGIIYCFCFLSIKTSQSRTNAVILNLLLLFQNLIVLAVFLMSFSDLSPRFAVLSFVTVTFGSLLGTTSFLIYNICFHPRGPFQCITSPNGSICCGATKDLFRKPSNFLVLTKNRKKLDTIHVNMESQDVQSPSDSIIIIEECQIPKIDEKTTETDTEEHIYDEPKADIIEKDAEAANLSAAMKRRAICSSIDLTKFLDKKTEDTFSESNKSPGVVASEENPSEILSTHDYENLCAVNISREPWGIRSWRVYSDIETYCHDDSVFNEKRLDNMTTSSEYSAKIEDKDSLNIKEENLLHYEIYTNSDKTSVSFISPFPASMLHSISEAQESFYGCAAHVEDTKAKCKSESALVATIDEICLYTPLRSRLGPVNKGDVRVSGKQLRNVKFDEESKVKREFRMEIDQKESFSPLKEKIQKFNIFKEKYETNSYQVCRKASVQGSGGLKLGETNKEKAPAATSRANSETMERIGIKRGSICKDKSLFLVQMLSPSKLERRTFPISDPKR